MSPSTRGCGLKFVRIPFAFVALHVTLYTRVWIEIDLKKRQSLGPTVTLYTRVWIEIQNRVNIR